MVTVMMMMVILTVIGDNGDEHDDDENGHHGDHDDADGHEDNDDHNDNIYIVIFPATLEATTMVMMGMLTMMATMMYFEPFAFCQQAHRQNCHSSSALPGQRPWTL